MPQAWADPYSGLARGLQMGQQFAANTQQMMMQKAEAKAAKEFQANTLNLKLAANEALPEADRVGYTNAIIDYSNKLGGTKTPHITSMANIKGKDMAQLLKIAENKDLPLSERIKMMPRKAAELGIGEGEYKPLMTSLQREQRRGLMYKPDIAGLPAKTVDIGGAGLTRPEIPSRPGGVTTEGRGLTGSQRQTFIETGQAQAPRKVIDAKGKGAGKDRRMWMESASKELGAQYGTLTEMGYVIDPENIDLRNDVNMLLEKYFEQGYNAKEATTRAISEAKMAGLIKKEGPAVREAAHESTDYDSLTEGGAELSGNTLNFQGKEYQLNSDGTVTIDGKKFKINK